MKKPKWAIRQNLRWKIVTDSFKSPVEPHQRLDEETGLWGSGTILTYSLKSLVISPNGLDTNPFHLCSRGIHAYTTRALARRKRNQRRNEIILKVYAPYWIGNDKSKQRAEQVWVDSIAR